MTLLPQQDGGGQASYPGADDDDLEAVLLAIELSIDRHFGGSQAHTHSLFLVLRVP